MKGRGGYWESSSAFLPESLPLRAEGPELVALCDRLGRLLSVNCAGARAWFGEERCREGDVLGKTWGEVGLFEEIVSVIDHRFAEVVNSGETVEEEIHVAPGADGSSGRVVECRLTPVPRVDVSVGVATVVVGLRDVTTARQAEEALRDRERQYRLLAENSSDMISRHDPSGVYLYVSPACQTMLGRVPEEMLGRTPYESIHPDDLAEAHRVHSMVLGSAESFTITFRARHAAGQYLWLETTSRAIRDSATGKVIEIHCATRDITPRKLVEQELRENRELLQVVLDNSPAVIYIKDVDGRYMLINRRFETLFKISRRQMKGRTDLDLFPEIQAKAFRENDQKVIDARGPLEFEEFAPHDDGLHTYVSVKFPLFDREGEPYAVCGISTDITPRHRAEQALRENRELLKQMLDGMADAVIVADQEERFLLFNPAAERMFGLGPTTTTSSEWAERYGLFQVDRITPFPADEIPLARAVRGDATNNVEMFVRHAARPEGLWILVNGRPLTDEEGRPRAGVVVCREITDRKIAMERLRVQNDQLKEVAERERQAHEALKQAEVQLVQAEKLTALGQMVAGVAHEINNPLSFVGNNIVVLQRDVKSMRQLLALYQTADPIIQASAPEQMLRIQGFADEVDLEYTLENIDRLTERSREGLRRIQQIVKDLREFARLDEGDLQSVDINSGITSTITIIHGRAVKQGVEIIRELNPIPRVTCYPGKINQVIMNLLANAIDACRPGDKVTVRTEPTPAADGVLIHVIDTGHGIPPEIRAKIFDPFFTTKPIGKGTGLGLSISYGIVKSHGGEISVDSEPGFGTTFKIRLPLSPPAPSLPAPEGGSIA